MAIMLLYSAISLDWQSRGKGFDPPHLHQTLSENRMVTGFTWNNGTKIYCENSKFKCRCS